MAFENIKETIEGLESFDDQSANQFRFQKLNANGRAQRCDADDLSVGVLQNKPSAAGYASTVAVSGRSKIVSDGSGVIAPGDSVVAGVDGKAKKAPPLAACPGYAVTGAGATDGEIFTMNIDMHQSGPA